MKQQKYIWILAAALLAACVAARAQQAELEAFQQAAGDRSALYRGLLAENSTVPANGHPYWDTPEYLRGDIVFEGNLYRDVPLNINAQTQHALVRTSNQVFSIMLSPVQVSALDIDGRHFVGIGPDEGALPEGFYEILGQGGVCVYKHVDKRLQSSVSDSNGDRIGYYDPNYRSDIFNYYAYLSAYYFRDRDGQFTRIRNRGALLREFPDKRKMIRKAVQDAGLLQPGSSFDAFCKAVLNLAGE